LIYLYRVKARSSNSVNRFFVNKVKDLEDKIEGKIMTLQAGLKIYVSTAFIALVPPKGQEPRLNGHTLSFIKYPYLNKFPEKKGDQWSILAQYQFRGRDKSVMFTWDDSHGWSHNVECFYVNACLKPVLEPNKVINPQYTGPSPIPFKVIDSPDVFVGIDGSSVIGELPSYLQNFIG
jgi:hypothetical protein